MVILTNKRDTLGSQSPGSAAVQCSSEIHQSLNGKQLLLEITKVPSSKDGQAVYGEYTISQEPLKLTRWFILSSIISGILFHMNFHQSNILFLIVLILSLSIALLVKLHWKVTKESLVVVSSLGLQFSTTFATGWSESHFIAKESIHDIVISEAISVCQVVFYLAVLLNEAGEVDSGVYPLFLKSSPRLDCLKRIYIDIHELNWFHIPESCADCCHVR